MGVLSGLIASSGLTPTYVNSATNASAGKLYQCDTSSAAFTVTLPTGSTGAVLRFVDDKGTWGTNSLTVAPAATQTIQGISGNGSLVCNLSGAYVEFTWDATNSQWCVQSTGFLYGPAATTTLAGVVKAQKQYVVGTAYTNGTPTVTCGQGGFAVTRGVLVPYQTVDGAWRLRFNVTVTWTSASVSGLAATLSGVTFKNIANFYQAVNGTPLSSTNQEIWQCYVSANTGTISAIWPSANTTTGMMLSGDVELDSKPTWAD